MSDFSIDMSRRQIYDARTRRYFHEVYTSYTSGNYRSAVVMLWSVVVCDLLFKLDEQRNMYADNIARDILNDVEKKRKANPKSPEWEAELLSLVGTKTELLSQSEVTNLQHLQDHRHLSAHPVLAQHEVLFSPTPDAVRCHIRHALEGVLMKPPLMTKKIFDTLVEELERISSLLLDSEELKTYLESKYFSHFATSVSSRIFRDLWQLVFLKTDARCETNRRINYRTLCILYERDPGAMDKTIQEETRKFSEIASEGEPFRHAISFLQRYPSIYRLLDESARTIIEKYSQQNINSYCRCPFLHDSMEAFLTGAIEQARRGEGELLKETFRELAQAAVAPMPLALLIELGAVMYTVSPNYDTADLRFDTMVKPFLDRYDQERIRVLLVGIESNPQTYARGRSRADHALVRQAAERLIPGFDVNEYPDFARHLPG